MGNNSVFRLGYILLGIAALLTQSCASNPIESSAKNKYSSLSCTELKNKIASNSKNLVESPKNLKNSNTEDTKGFIGKIKSLVQKDSTGQKNILRLKSERDLLEKARSSKNCA